MFARVCVRARTEDRNGVFISVYVCGGYRARVCASPASPARGPRSPFAVSRPPNYLPLRSKLNESRRVTSLSAVSPPPRRPTATSDVPGMIIDRNGAGRARAKEKERETVGEREETVLGLLGKRRRGKEREKAEKLGKFYQAIFLTRNG